MVVRGKPPAPGPAFAPRWDPDPRWTSRSERRRPVQGLGRDDPAGAVAGARALPFARVCAASRDKRGPGDKKGRNPSRFFRRASETK